MRILLPEGWPRPQGYSNGIEASGRQIFIAGMIGWDENKKFASGFVDQFEQVLRNTTEVLNEAGATPGDIVRMTWFVKGIDHYRSNLPQIGRIYRAILGKSYPTMAVIGVSDLVEAEALIEIETTAVIADEQI